MGFEFLHSSLSQYLLPNKPRNPDLDIVLLQLGQKTPTPIAIVLHNGGGGGAGSISLFFFII
jgi:hypothetical protein